MTGIAVPAETWWGNYKLDFETSRIWNIGPLTRIVRCLKDAQGIEIPFPHRILYSGSVTDPFPVRSVTSR